MLTCMHWYHPTGTLMQTGDANASLSTVPCVKLCCASQAEDAREKAAAAAADAAKLAAQAQVLGREAKLGRELRDDNYRLEESLHAYALVLLCLSVFPCCLHYIMQGALVLQKLSSALRLIGVMTTELED